MAAAANDDGACDLRYSRTTTVLGVAEAAGPCTRVVGRHDPVAYRNGFDSCGRQSGCLVLPQMGSATLAAVHYCGDVLGQRRLAATRCHY
jgi:hypothetical protein